MNYKKYTDYSQLVEGKDRRTIENEILEFLIWLKEERKMMPKTRYNHLAVLTFFYNQIAELPINSKKLSRCIGNDESDPDAPEDRGYTREEIAQLLTVCDQRLRMAVLIMSSAGLLSWSTSYSRLGHMTKIDNIYKFKVYATNKKDKYYTFTTPECAATIDNYLDYRKRCGERLTDKITIISK